jgi:hypothetical protein
MAEPVALSVKPPTTMTLGDMVNMARGAQAYQQAEQVNPLALQQAQQAARTGEIDLSVKEQGDLERKNLQTYMAGKKWLDENGEVNVPEMTKKIIEIAPLTGPPNIEKLTTLAKSQNEYNKSSQDLNQNERAIIGNALGVLGRMGIQKREVYLQELDNTASYHSNNKKILRQIEAQKALIKQMPEGSDFASAGIRASQSLLNPEQAQAAFAPKAKGLDTGPQIIETVETPSIGTNAPTIARTGNIISGKSIAPQVYTTETGAPGIIGVGGNENLPPPANVLKPPVNVAPSPTGAPTGVSLGLPTSAPKVAPSATPAGKQLVDQFNATGSLQRAPDETYDRYKKRVEAIAVKPEQANNAMNLANRDSIPNQEKTNNQILQLLDKKNLNIGPLANAIANKTGGVGLTDDEQTVVKYLEQRIRMESARSNQDESSQRSAFGSFKNSKDALREIIFNDKGLLASQKLYNQGILKAQGNPNKPNLAAINNFENNFNQLNQDPNLPHLLGVMGNKKMEQLTDSERIHLDKYFSKMSDDEIRKLFADRDALLNLVRGGK